MNLDQIPGRLPDGSVNVFVECPRGSRTKYEFNEDLGVMVLDRTLHAAVYFPAGYGFVPGTRSSDGERLDALVLGDEPAFPGCLARVRLLGVLAIATGHGSEDKLLGAPVGEPRFAEYQDVVDLPSHLLKEIEHFFEVYRQLEGKDMASLGWDGAERARTVLDGATALAGRDGIGAP